jgi:predicted transcriptional regulator
MSTAAKQLLDQVMSLDERDRMDFLSQLIERMDGPADADYEQAWGEEIKTRLEEIDSGRARMIPAEEAIKQIRKRAGCEE